MMSPSRLLSGLWNQISMPTSERFEHTRKRVSLDRDAWMEEHGRHYSAAKPLEQFCHLAFLFIIRPNWPSAKSCRSFIPSTSLGASQLCGIRTSIGIASPSHFLPATSPPRNTPCYTDRCTLKSRARCVIGSFTSRDRNTTILLTMLLG